MFDKLFELLSTYEQGMADATLRKPSAIKSQLSDIIREATVLTNRGGLPSGSKSVMSRIVKLCEDALRGLNAQEISLGELRLSMSRDKLGPLHTALQTAVHGKLSATDKAQVREYETDENKAAEIQRLTSSYDPGKTDIRGEEYNAKDIHDLLGYFLATNFSVSQLRSITPEMLKPYSLREFYDTQNGPNAQKNTGIIRRELSQKHDDTYAELSTSYKGLEKRIPAKIPHGAPFTAITYPVVPLFDDINAMKDPGKLERAGFTVTPIGDHFIVLENQYLLCLDLSKMEVDSSIRMSRDNQKIKTVNNSGALMEAIEQVLEIVNRRAPKKFAIASQTIVRNPHNPGIALVWIMTEHSRQMLEKTLRTRRVDWDIPRHNIQATRLSHGVTPAETQKLIDDSNSRNHNLSVQTDASLRRLKKK